MERAVVSGIGGQARYGLGAMRLAPGLNRMERR